MAATGSAWQELHHGHLLIKSCTKLTGLGFVLFPHAMQALDVHNATSKLSCYLMLEGQPLERNQGLPGEMKLQPLAAASHD